jgi:hypothetical protein
MAIRIGLIGASGSVGSILTNFLRADARLELICAARSLAPNLLQPVAAQAAIKWQSLDIFDEAALLGFCKSCDIVVNCAGPAAAVQYRVYAVTERLALPYVDVAAHAPKGNLGGANALFAAGLSPGWSGLVPRYLSERFEQVLECAVAVGGCDTISLCAAEDFLASMMEETGGRAKIWQAETGQPDSNKAAVRLAAYFPAGAALRPFLSTEANALIHAHKFRRFACFMVYDGREGLAALARSIAARDPGPLVAASRRDTFGRRTYQSLICEVRGVEGGREVTRALHLGGRSGAQLTALAAAAALCDLIARPDEGVAGDFATHADSVRALDLLRAAPGVSVTEFASLHDRFEEGTL